MKKLILTLILVIASTCAIAAKLDSDSARQAGFDDLSPQQQADVIKMITDKRAAETSSPLSTVPTTKNVNDWLDIGQRIGSGMAGAAKEMGIAVNEFAKSPVGLWTITLITWHFMGGMVTHIIGGLLIWLIGFSIVLWFSRRSVEYKRIYDKEKKDIFGRSCLASVTRDEMSSDALVGFLFCSAVVLAAGTIVIFSY